MNKRLICLLLAVVAVTMCGCLGKTEPPSSDPVYPFTTEPSTEVPAETTLPVTEPTTVPTEPTVPPTTEATVPPTEETTAPTEATTEATEPTQAVSTTGEKVAKTAKEQVGKDYALNTTGPDTFDTSGLVYYCFAQQGIKVPRNTRTQVTHGTEVAKEDLQPGDVVFFWTSNEGKAEYVGIYVGGGKMVAARSEGKPVSEMNMMGPYFTEHYVTARRFTDGT